MAASFGACRNLTEAFAAMGRSCREVAGQDSA